MKTYISRVSDLLGNHPVSFFYPDISLYRRKKIDSFVFEKDKRLSLGVELLLRRACRDGGIPVSDIVEGPNGKPSMPSVGSFHYNLSHSEEMVMCVVADSPVGCDVEKIVPGSLSLADRYFYRSEYNLIQAQPTEDLKMLMFYRLWTIKESFMKATGRGMGLPLDSFEVRIFPDRVEIEQDICPYTCKVTEFFRNDGYCYAACSLEKE